MRDGFIKVGAATPKVKVADPVYNTDLILQCYEEAKKEGAKIFVLPELCMTGYTCGDLFLQEPMLKETKKQLLRVVEATKGSDLMLWIGLPLVVEHKLYNCAAAIQDGRLLGIVPKYHLPNYGEFYEARHFAKGSKEVKNIRIGKEEVPFGMNLLFCCEEMEELVVACEICEDLWAPLPPSTMHAVNGATLICNLSASVETTTKDNYRRNLIHSQSARTVSAYIYADAGEGESTTDVVYSAHNLISENGSCIKEAKRFCNETIYGEIDLYRLVADRRKMTTYLPEGEEKYEKVYFSLKEEETKLTRTFARTPFIPSAKFDREKRCEEILTIQSMGLKKRLEHAHCQSAVIGLSGGLDSTLALLVTVAAFDKLGLDRKKILSVTMPCYGTTDRTYQNALTLARTLKTTLKEVNIVNAVEQHFRDIEHDKDVHDVTYENSQARERTQILMDLANQSNGMVIGTGDMSELALGWATYNGDHMSMYGVNASVPKTLVRHLVKYYADTCENKELEAALLDVLDTPVSPELLPPVDGVISQKTEDLVGPYELHDFFLYYIIRFGFSPTKIYRIAKQTFLGVYSDEVILKWLRTFYWRFFAQQFKRSCIPDGPKVGSIALSPRGDWRMPSDASVSLWLEEVKALQGE